MDNDNERESLEFIRQLNYNSIGSGFKVIRRRKGYNRYIKYYEVMTLEGINSTWLIETSANKKVAELKKNGIDSKVKSRMLVFYDE